jgi:hypothetical protein
VGFWSDKLNELNPQPVQQQPVVQDVPWWQQGQPQRPMQQQNTVPQQQVHAVQGYAPSTADVVTAEIDLCPRCGSEDYAALSLMPNPGGQAIVGKAKQCFDCRYPAPNATGDLVTAGFTGNVEQVETRTTRYAAGPRMQAQNPKVGSWSQVSTGEALGNTPIIR